MASFEPQEYVVVESIEEVASLLSQYGDRAKVIAGGTLIYELANRNLIGDVELMVDLHKLQLSYVDEKEDHIRIGAMTTLSNTLSLLPDAQHSLAALKEALKAISPLQIRNVATVGGEICSSFAQLDLPPALIALGAKLVVFGPKGRREIEIGEFFVDHFLTSLRRGEFLIELMIPKHDARTGSAFEKFERNAVDLATLNVASLVTLDASARCIEARIVLGGASRTPIRAAEAEKKLIGRRIDEKTAAEAGKNVSEEIKPANSIEGSSWFKKQISKVLVRKTVLRAARIAEKP